MRRCGKQIPDSRMMKYISFYILTALLTQFAFSQTHPGLVIALDSMVKEDQKWRMMIHQVRNGEVDSITEEFVWERIHQVDEATYFVVNPLFLHIWFSRL